MEVYGIRITPLFVEVLSDATNSGLLGLGEVDFVSLEHFFGVVKADWLDRQLSHSVPLPFFHLVREGFLIHREERDLRRRWPRKQAVSHFDLKPGCESV